MAKLRYHPGFDRGRRGVIYLEDGTSFDVLAELAEVSEKYPDKLDKLEDLLELLQRDGKIHNNKQCRDIKGCKGLLELKANPCRLYWHWHLNCICLVLAVVEGKKRQEADARQACKRKEVAQGITEITED